MRVWGRDSDNQSGKHGGATTEDRSIKRYKLYNSLDAIRDATTMPSPLQRPADYKKLSLTAPLILSATTDLTVAPLLRH